MSLLLVESVPDVASRGIAAALRKRPEWAESGQSFEGHPVWRHAGTGTVLATTESMHIQAEGLDTRLADAGLRADAIVFLSKHRSESGRPTLTAHPLGNFVNADFGGRPGRLTPSPGPLLTQTLRHLQTAKARRNYQAEVSFEATHHGPLLATPAFFVELGSSDAQWNDPAGHEVLADAVEALITTVPPAFPIVIGLGGGHYVPRFSEAALTKEVHFAHLVPSHHAKHIADPGPLAGEIVRASPGAVGYYYHDGSLPKESRETWFRAFADLGLPQLQSRAWPLLQTMG